MSLFLLTSLPLILKIYINTQLKQSKTKNTQAHILAIFFAITIFSFLYLTQEFILYRSFELNYTSRINLGISIFIKEHLYFYILPLLIFIFFFTLNETSSFNKNSTILIYFAFGLIFSKNLEIVILNSKIFGIYEYIELPILNAIELIFSAIIFEKKVKKMPNILAKRIQNHSFSYSIFRIIYCNLKNISSNQYEYLCVNNACISFNIYSN